MANGIRVSKPGYPVETASPPQLVFSSEYETLRVQQQGTGNLTDSGGRAVTIPHNLGYVPMFMVHANIFGGSLYYQLPYVDGSNNPQVTCWADSTNLYIRASSDLGWIYFGTNDVGSNYAYKSSFSGVHYGAGANLGNTAGTNYDGALRFPNVTIPQGTNVYRAYLMYYINVRNGTNDVNGLLYGIEQPNTAAFSSSDDPFNRPHHDGSGPFDITIGAGAGVGSVEQWTVTSIVTELAGQGSWVSGNPMGFVFLNDASSNGEVETDIGNSGTRLKVLLSDTLFSYRYTIYKDRIE